MSQKKARAEAAEKIAIINQSQNDRGEKLLLLGVMHHTTIAIAIPKESDTRATLPSPPNP
jgi:hypothetical protein